jgi:Ca-activated chloride channel family protein
VSQVNLDNVRALYLLWALPGVLVLYLYAAGRRGKALRAFAEADLLRHINVNVSAARRRWKAALVLAAFGAVVLALTRPGWNPRPETLERRGRDVVFLLDVSRSMLAEDLKPNRLEHAKLAIRDCVEAAEGDRVALVAFAGSAAVKCPLTLDYGFFGMMLDAVGSDSIERGGTAIGDAIRKALDEVFDDREKKHKDVILITDGEDHDSFPVEAAKEAGERGVRILAVGLGDEEQGERIPVTDESGRRTFLQYKGQEVWARLDADTLRKVVNVTPEGKYLNVATGTIDLADVYRKLVAAAEQRELEAKTVTRYEDRFQVFIAAACALLWAELAVSDRRRRAPH